MRFDLKLVPTGDAFLKFFDIVVLEFDDAPAFPADKMIMMLCRVTWFETLPTVGKIALGCQTASIQ